MRGEEEDTHIPLEREIETERERQTDRHTEKGEQNNVECDRRDHYRTYK